MRTSLVDRIKDPRENAIDIQQDIGIPESKDQESLTLKPSITAYVTLALRGCSVLTSVQFDDDADIE